MVAVNAKKLILTALIISSYNSLFSQSHSFVVPAGGNPGKLLPREIRLLNLSFKSGYLKFMNDSKTRFYELNIDLYCGCIAFINKEEDTTLVIHDLNVKGLHIGDNEYVHLQKTGYLKVLASNSMYMLASRTKLIGRAIEEVVNIGYGTVPAASVTSSIKSNSITTDTQYSREIEWFLLDQRGSILKADKRNYLKMFYRRADEIKAFMKTERIDYKKEEDLTNLFKFCLSTLDSRDFQR